LNRSDDNSRDDLEMTSPTKRRRSNTLECEAADE
jgi:hypothetical protein